MSPLIDEFTDQRARLAVCDRAGRGRDLGDPVQLADAAADAGVVLGILGLLGEQPGRPSPGERKNIGMRVVHGTRSAVQAHVEAGQWLCDACQRWADVQERKRGRPQG